MNEPFFSDMKKTSILLALALATLPLSEAVAAARQFPNFEAAQAVGQKSGYIVFIYPSGWDRYGEKLCRKLIADTRVLKAAGNAALLLSPIYQNRNEDTNAKVKQIMGKLGYPGDMADISYPAIALYEKDGRMFATIHGEELMKAKPEEVAQLISRKLEANRRQSQILQQAHAAKDAKEKNRLFLASSRVPGLGWPPGLKEVMKQVDPEDNHGYRAALEFGFGTQKDESMEDFLKRLDGVLVNELLTPAQKQRACAVAIGHIRRSLGTTAGASLISKYAAAMHKFDPDSTLGLSAPVVMRDWVRQFRYGQGWSPEVIPGCDMPLLMHDVPISKPGSYDVNFRFETGRDGIHINRLRLMDGNRCVAEDATPHVVNLSARQHTTTFTVSKELKKPRLEFTFGNAPDKRSTWGYITVTPK